MKTRPMNPNLWQKKRGELPVNGDPQLDWLQMQAMLDRAMPVSAPVNKPFRIKHTNWWVKGLIVTTSTIVIYAIVQLSISNRHNAVPVNQQQGKRDTAVTPVKNEPPLVDTVKNDSVLSGKHNLLQGQPVKSSHVMSPPKNVKDSVAGRQHGAIDSGKNQPGSNNFRNIDSLLSPSTITPIKTGRDSAKLPTINNRTIPKDTSKKDNNKGQKKKKKPRVNIFT